MKFDKTVNTFLTLLSVLMILITAFYVERLITHNNVSSVYTSKLSLTGAKLSDDLYAKVSKTMVQKTDNGSLTQYEIEIVNSGDTDITNWNLKMAYFPTVKVIDVHDVEGEPEGDSYIFTPLYNNMTIKAGESCEFGMAIDASADYAPTSMVLTGFKLDPTGSTLGNKLISALFVLWIVFCASYMVVKYNSISFLKKQKNDIRIILQSMNTFISFIDAKDPYTRGHSRRVAMYAAEISKRMHLTESEIQNVYYAGLLHDAGKISVPDAILNKPGKLTNEERQLVQNHTVAGGNMLKQLSSLKGVRETALYHHERFDGKGYPEGLKGSEIPLYARIVGVADSYDAMSSNRVYRRHLSKDEIIEEMQKGSGSQFDPEIVPYMVDMINDGYVNVVKMETAEDEGGDDKLHISEEDIPGLYMGL
ncbi:MAG: HD domain-containing protein [Butyrivibrio sp.]|nr:HD domain-containing protein [Butyrivibrio sp.]